MWLGAEGQGVRAWQGTLGGGGSVLPTGVREGVPADDNEKAGNQADKAGSGARAANGDESSDEGVCDREISYWTAKAVRRRTRAAIHGTRTVRLVCCIEQTVESSKYIF